jgi:hypothetical protein
MNDEEFAMSQQAGGEVARRLRASAKRININFGKRQND